MHSHIHMHFQKIVFGDLGQRIQIVTSPVEVGRCSKQGQNLWLKLMGEYAMAFIRRKWIVIPMSVVILVSLKVFYELPNYHTLYTVKYFQKTVFGDLGQSIQIVTNPVEVGRCTKQGQSSLLKLMEEFAMVGIRMK